MIKGKKKKEKRGGEGKRVLLECFTSICTIMRVSERKRERERTYSSGKSKVSDSKASQRVGIIKTTEGKCFRVGG